MMPRKLPEASVDAVSLEAMYSSYSVRCRLLSRQRNTCSCFPGSPFSTSLFSRRSRNGRSTLCSRSTTPCSMRGKAWVTSHPSMQEFQG